MHERGCTASGRGRGTGRRGAYGADPSGATANVSVSVSAGRASGPADIIQEVTSRTCPIIPLPPIGPRRTRRTRRCFYTGPSLRVSRSARRCRWLADTVRHTHTHTLSLSLSLSLVSIFERESGLFRFRPAVLASGVQNVRETERERERRKKRRRM